MAEKTTSGSGFRPYSCSPPDLVVSGQNLEIFQGHFFEIFEVKVENFKKYLNVLQEFPIQKF